MVKSQLKTKSSRSITTKFTKKKVVSKSGGCITTNDSIKLLNDERDAKRRKIEEAEMNFNIISSIIVVNFVILVK